VSTLVLADYLIRLLSRNPSMIRDYIYDLEVIRKTNANGTWPIRRYPQIRIQRIDEQLGALVGDVFRK
jgi:hypothetical protein